MPASKIQLPNLIAGSVLAGGAAAMGYYSSAMGGYGVVGTLAQGAAAYFVCKNDIASIYQNAGNYLNQRSLRNHHVISLCGILGGAIGAQNAWNYGSGPFAVASIAASLASGIWFLSHKDQIVFSESTSGLSRLIGKNSPHHLAYPSIVTLKIGNYISAAFPTIEAAVFARQFETDFLANHLADFEGCSVDEIRKLHNPEKAENLQNLRWGESTEKQRNGVRICLKKMLFEKYGIANYSYDIFRNTTGVSNPKHTLEQKKLRETLLEIADELKYVPDPDSFLTRPMSSGIGLLTVNQIEGLLLQCAKIIKGGPNAEKEAWDSLQKEEAQLKEDCKERPRPPADGAKRVQIQPPVNTTEATSAVNTK